MILEKLRGWARQEGEKLSSLSPRGKWDYIWMYYKWWILGLAVLIVAVIWGVQDYQYARREILISGIFINTTTSPEGYAFVDEELWAALGSDPNTRVELIEARSIRFDVEQPTESDVNAVMSVDTQIASQSLDYIVGDLSVVEYYGGRGDCMDLTTLFSPEQLARWEVVEIEGTPVAVDLTGSRLEQGYGLYAEPSYLMLLVNTTRPQRCAEFMEYLWGK